MSSHCRACPIHALMIEPLATHRSRAAFIAALLLVSLTGCSEPNDREAANENSEPAVIVTDKKTVDNRAKIVGQTPIDDKGEIRQPALKIILSTEFKDADTQAQATFNCDDKIYSVINFQNYETAMYDIRVVWTDPFDKEREVTEFPYFVNSDNIYAWSSLSLHRGVGAGMLQWINPAAGMEEFIGEWRIRVFINNQSTAEGTFEVLC